ncbi:DUF3526 domain-containing protein [Litorimonas haliclonae]|uniref:DUF3526 domain-containing protein n=1 Tax=Litorimonas haliclonae TaxID=2081977 RepID=UPI0039EEE05D
MITLIKFDALQLLRDRLAIFILGVGFLATLVAVVTGASWNNYLQNDYARVYEASQDYRAEQRKDWVNASNTDRAAAVILPLRLVTTVQLAPPLMADFAIGRSAIEPASADVRSRTRPDIMFRRYQIDNPERLRRGALDLSFVVIVIAPLLLIAIGYGIFTSDRERGTARLWVAQAGNPLPLITARSLNRFSIVFVPILIGALIMWALGPTGRGLDILLWLSVAFIGLLFWWAVILLVNTLPIAAETAAMLLIGIWTTLVFVAPMAIFAASSLINPPPSKFESIAVARAAEISSAKIYDDDHPELSSSALEVRKSSVQKSIDVRAAVADAIAPIQAKQKAHEESQAKFAYRLAYLSPPLLTSDLLAGVSGTDGPSYARRKKSAQAYLPTLSGALSSKVVNDGAIDGSSFDALPVYTPASHSRPSFVPLAWILFLTLLIGGWATMRLRHTSPL